MAKAVRSSSSVGTGGRWPSKVVEAEATPVVWKKVEATHRRTTVFECRRLMDYRDACLAG